MNYAVRNTLIIAAFWSVILAGGFYYVYGYQKKVQERLQTENQAKLARLNDLTYLEKDRSELRIHLRRLQDISLGRMGTISAHESPGETYDYILRELERTRSRLNVSFVYKNEDTYLTMKRRYYEIKGSGPFLDFYKLLWFLENGPIFYGVKGLDLEPQLNKSGQGRTEDVAFSLDINGYERKEGPDITTITVRQGDYPQIVNLVKGRPQRLFRQGTAQPGSTLPGQPTGDGPQPQPEKNVEKLPEVDQRTQILAIMPGAAVIKDHTGRTFRLKPGDRIFRGTVSQINPGNGTIQFAMQGSGNSSTLILPNGSN